MMDSVIRRLRLQAGDGAAEAATLPIAVRIAEALLFAAPEPLDEADIAAALPHGVAVSVVMAQLQSDYAARGVNLVRVAGKWQFRTAPDLAHVLTRSVDEARKLSRPALETLAIIAYHQPITRAEIEEIRGVSTSKGTLDILLQTGWVRLRGRRKSPGRPITLGTTDAFLAHFGLESISDLPGIEDLRGAGLFEGRLPPGLGVPVPDDDAALRADEDALEGDVVLNSLEERINEPVERLDPDGDGASSQTSRTAGNGRPA
jgi:segregation and condensation protein B